MVVPASLSIQALVLLGNLAALLGVLALFRRAGARIGGLALALSTWLLVASALAVAGFYEGMVAGRLPLVLPGLAVPLGVALAALATERVRSLARLMDIRWLVGIQTYRAAGFAFVVAMWAGHLPAVFAVPAGVGDVLVGLAAPPVAWLALRVRHGRWVASAWNALGVLDLALAFTLANLAGSHAGNVLGAAPTTAAMTQYPLVLIPTVMVPVSVFLHLLTHVRLRRGPVAVSHLERASHQGEMPGLRPEGQT